MFRIKTHRLIGGLLLNGRHFRFNHCLGLVAQHHLHDQTACFNETNENSCFSSHEMVLVIVG